VSILETRYAEADEGVRIAYQVFGDGDVGLALIPGFVSHLEFLGEYPPFADLRAGWVRSHESSRSTGVGRGCPIR